MQLINLIVVLSTLSVVSANSIAQVAKFMIEEKKQAMETKNVLRKETGKKLQGAGDYWALALYDTEAACTDANLMSSASAASNGNSGQCYSETSDDGSDISYKGTCSSDGSTFTYIIYSDADCVTENVVVAQDQAVDTCYTWSYLGIDVGGAQGQCSSSPISLGDDDDSVCFAGSETLLLESGVSVAMEDVKIGDRVQVAAADGSLDFADVISLPHAQNSIVSSFVEIETATSSLKATPTHLVMTCDKSLVRAENVAVGACLATVAGEETVTAASTIQGQGVYSAVTSHADGIIVVNGFKASSFALNHNVANAYYNIHRALYAYAPSMVAGLSGLTAFLGKLAFGAYSA